VIHEASAINSLLLLLVCDVNKITVSLYFDFNQAGVLSQFLKFTVGYEMPTC
jgi:hypothetical protein